MRHELWTLTRGDDGRVKKMDLVLFGSSAAAFESVLGIIKGADPEPRSSREEGRS